MAVEIFNQESDAHALKVLSLEAFLLMTLEHHDGLCLDNEPERIQLAAALAAAFIRATRDGTVYVSIVAREQDRFDGNPAPK